MDSQYRGIIQLARSALTGREEQLPPAFDLEQAYPIVRAHQIAPLVYEGARRCGFSAEEPMMRSLFRDYCQELLRSERQMRSVDALRAALDQAGLEYLFFKGVVMKERYPKPELRPMGDADLLIREEQFPAVDTLLRAQGYELKGKTPQEWQYFSDGLMLEPHRLLVDPEDARDLAVFGSGWDMTQISETGRPALTPEAETAYMVSHLAKHVRLGGIGLRQMIDLWVLGCDCPPAPGSPLAELLERLGLAVFYGNVIRTLRVWFADEPEDETTELITRFVFSSGSFGTERSQVLSVTLRKTGGRGVRRYGIRSRLFPPRRVLLDRYPALVRHPSLLPLVWAYRLIHMLFFKRKKVANGLRRLGMINRSDIQRYANTLRAMGLNEAEKRI